MNIEINGTTWSTREILHGYCGRVEVLTHEDCDAMDEQEIHAIYSEIVGLVAESGDLTADQIAEGYAPQDIDFTHDLTDTGVDAQVNWPTSAANRDNRLQDEGR